MALRAAENLDEQRQEADQEEGKGTREGKNTRSGEISREGRHICRGEGVSKGLKAELSIHIPELSVCWMIVLQTHRTLEW